MKSAVLTLATSLAVASAVPGAVPSDVPITCAKPNASYCMSGDIIVKCDGSSLGTRSRCSDNVASYPPADGTTSCYQSSEMAGDAACVKNCVVYASQPFTLPADKCTPNAAATGGQQNVQTQLSIANTGTAAPQSTSMASFRHQAYTETDYYSIPTTDFRDHFPEGPDTAIFSIPEGTSQWGPVYPTITSRLPEPRRTSTGFGYPSNPAYPPNPGYPPYPGYPSHSAYPSHSYPYDDEDEDCPVPTPPPAYTSGRGGSPGTTATRPTSGPGGIATLPATAAANTNHAAGVLAAAGFAAAVLL